MSNLRLIVSREDVRGLDFQFWHGPTSYNHDSIREWQAEHGSPYHVVDFAWRYSILEASYAEFDMNPDSETAKVRWHEIHTDYAETWADAMDEGTYILSEPRSIEGPDRAWERDYYLNANKV